MNKLKHLITPKYILLLLLLLSSLVIGAFLLPHFFSETRDMREVEYVLLFENMEAEEKQVKSLIPIGSAVYSSNGTVHLGKVTRVEAKPHRVPILQDGTIAFSDFPNRYDITVRVRAKGEAPNTMGWRLSELRIAAGAKGSFYVGAYFGDATILGIGEVRE